MCINRLVAHYVSSCYVPHIRRRGRMRVSIPEGVRRQLRQEAGFGCCNCGHPFLEYHHIIPYAEEPHNRPNDMVALCGNCHHLATTGAISESEQRNMKDRPCNVVDGFARGRLFVNSEDLVVNLAGGRAINTPTLLAYQGVEIVGVRRSVDGRILASALIHNDKGEVVAELRDNEWSVSTAAVWDFESYPLHAKVRLGAGNIAFSIDCRNDMIQLTGNWYLGGAPIRFTPSTCKVRQGEISGSECWNSRIYLSLC